MSGFGQRQGTYGTGNQPFAFPKVLGPVSLRGMFLSSEPRGVAVAVALGAGLLLVAAALVRRSRYPALLYICVRHIALQVCDSKLKQLSLEMISNSRMYLKVG